MAIGDDATAAGIPLVQGTDEANDIDELINRLADEVARRTRYSTGSTAAEARQAMGAAASTHNHSGQYIAHGGSDQGEIAIAHGGGRAQLFAGGIFKGLIAYLGDIPAPVDVSGKRNYADGYFPEDLSAKNLYVRESFPATAGYTVAYINQDGRLSKNASSARYKKFISPVDPLDLGDLFPEFSQWQMRSQPGSPSDGHWRYGYIAEVIANHPDTEPFTVYTEIDGERVPESIDFIGLLLAQTAQLARLLDLAAQRIAALEGRIGPE